MSANPALAIDLENLLKAECDLYREYIELLGKERQAVIRFKIPEVQAITARRAELSTAMGEAHHKRLQVLKRLPDGDCEKLTTLISRHCSITEERKLKVLANDLKSLIQASQSTSMQVGQVVTYALNLVNGSISLLWSATQNVFKAYGKKGNIKESYHPTDPKQGVIRKA